MARPLLLKELALWGCQRGLAFSMELGPSFPSSGRGSEPPLAGCSGLGPGCGGRADVPQWFLMPPACLHVR